MRSRNSRQNKPIGSKENLWEPMGGLQNWLKLNSTKPLLFSFIVQAYYQKWAKLLGITV